MRRKTKQITVKQYCEIKGYASTSYVVKCIAENKITLLDGVLTAEKIGGKKTAPYILTVDSEKLGL